MTSLTVYTIFPKNAGTSLRALFRCPTSRDSLMGHAELTYGTSFERPDAL